MGLIEPLRCMAISSTRSIWTRLSTSSDTDVALVISPIMPMGELPEASWKSCSLMMPTARFFSVTTRWLTPKRLMSSRASKV